MTQPHPSTAHTARDREWIARIRAGDYDAFVACFRAYYGSALAFASHLLGTGEEDAAEDVVQDVFFAIWQRRETWVVSTSLGAYIHGAVRNRVATQFRHRRVRRRLEGFVREVFDRDVRRPDADIVAADLDATVRRLIEQLPSRCREVYELRWHHQLSYAEIAHLLGISVKTVETHVTTALKHLRTSLPDLL